MGIRDEAGPCLWLGLGNLNNAGNAGLFYVNGNNGLGNTNWNIGSRQSGWHSLHHVPPTARPPEGDAARPLN